jgi:hypothetical protein
VVVGRFDNAVADGPELGVGLFFSKTATSSSFPGPFFTGNVSGGVTSGPAATGLAFSTSFNAGDSVASSTAYNDNTPHAFAFQRVSGKIDLRVDAVSLGTSVSSDNDVSNSGVAVRIGADASGQAIRLDGDISELMAVKGTLSLADRVGLEAYLKSKYGL